MYMAKSAAAFVDSERRVYREKQVKDEKYGKQIFDTLYELRRKREISGLGMGGFSYTLIDEESRININKVPLEALEQLPGLDAETAKSISDYIKIQPLDLKEELLLIDGVTPEIYSQFSGYITVYTEGKVNINTAPYEVIKILASGSGLDGAIADDIEDIREIEAGQNPEAESGFKNIADFKMRAASLPPDRAVAIGQLADQYFTVQSRVFTVQIETNVLSRPSKNYHIVMDINTEGDTKIRQWAEDVKIAKEE